MKKIRILFFFAVFFIISACTVFDSNIYFESQEDALNSIDEELPEDYEIITEKSLGDSTFFILYYDDLDAVRNVIISKGKNNKFYLDKVDAKFVLSSQKGHNIDLGFRKSEKITNIIVGNLEFEGEDIRYFMWRGDYTEEDLRESLKEDFDKIQLDEIQEVAPDIYLVYY